MLHKRETFAHEREIRAVAFGPAFQFGHGLIPSQFPASGRSLAVDWDAQKVVESVYVGPYAHEWYRDVIAVVLEEFAPTLAKQLRWSAMKGTPRF
jgi:hypothetical protein